MKYKKVKRAELRKESQSFDGWLKYEIEVIDEKGNTETIPAYGKDLQDALDRVVHDDRVKSVLPKIQKVPSIIWVLLWVSILSYSTYIIDQHYKVLGDWIALIYFAMIGILTLFTVSISNWFTLKNRKSA